MNHQSDRVLVRLLAFGGLRINECFALQWSDVDLERKTLTVRQSVADVNGRLIVGPTKTYATRTITLPDAIRAQLLTLKNSKSAMALVFPGRGGVYRRYGTGVVTSGTRPAKHPASLRDPMIFGKCARRF
jgi:integrase